MGLFGTLKNIGKTALKVAKPLAAVGSAVGVPGMGALNSAFQLADTAGAALKKPTPAPVIQTAAPSRGGLSGYAPTVSLGIGGSFLGRAQATFERANQTVQQTYGINQPAVPVGPAGITAPVPMAEPGAGAGAGIPTWLMVVGGVVLAKLLGIFGK